VGRACNHNGGTLHTKESPAANNSGNRRVGQPRKRWEDRVREDAVALRGTWALKTKLKDRENSGCNDLNRLRLNLVCITTAAVATAHITEVIHVPAHMTSV
jgi:hypothetical protein